MQNIISHGGKSPMINIRVTIENDKLVMCLKDSGTPFDLKKEKEQHIHADSCGLKLICTLAEEISYYRLYNTNTTIVKI